MLRERRTLKLFEEMLVRDAVAWTDSEVEPDDVTCILLLQACMTLGALNFVVRVWAYAEERGYAAELKVCISLIAMI